MIVSNLATYPPRTGNIPEVLRRLSPQVDQVNIVLNEFESVPDECKGFDNVNPILPHEDTKDVGKFLPDVSGADYVLLHDDDILYPPDYVERSIAELEKLPFERAAGGYHGSIYRCPKLKPTIKSIKANIRFRMSPSHIARFRRFLHFGETYHDAILVDQLGTGAVITRGADMPSYEYMRTSQQFVDVRYAKWCAEQGIERVSLPREGSWLRTIKMEESILRGFTYQHHDHVAKEIWSFALKHAGRGDVVASKHQAS